jgi:peptidoglycan/xylan/chitin deacetylase (PgdA/CDA1 family)
LDQALASLLVPVQKERGVLLSFLFHGAFEDADELAAGALDPQQGITLPMLRGFIEYFLEQSYRFASPQEIVLGLPRDGRYVLLTFDDGYYNNTRVMPLLKEYNVPAVFFISAEHVKNGKAFWWDVVFRELKQRGGTHEQIVRACADYKALKTEYLESLLIKKFGERVLKPIGDLDRPFTPAELNTFAEEQFVILGNHTSNHAILTNYSTEEIRRQIVDCQTAIREMTGKTPSIISYPNGNNSPEICEAARICGLELGVGVLPGRNRVPLKMGTQQAMSLKRFTLWGDREIDRQCRVSRSAVSLHRIFNAARPRVNNHVAAFGLN